MKYTALIALVSVVAAADIYPTSYIAIQSTSSSTSASDEEDLALSDFHPGMDESEFYTRVVPVHFTADSDDLFMRSMFKKYAMEGAHKKEDGGGPNGDFYMTKAIMGAVAREVLATHKGLSGAALESYLASYFDKALAHFDVNQT